MKLAACFLLAVEAKIKLKSIEIPDEGFFTMEQSSEKHHGLPDDNKAYSHYIEPTARERQYHGACFNGSPHDLGVKNGEHSENSKWRCALVNKKRKNADRPRDFVCFPQCMAWTKQKQTSNPDSFAGCRLHAPITNPINGWAVCQKGQWVVQNPLKKCFCDLCDPADAQKQLRKKQKAGRHPDYGADFSKPKSGWWAAGNEDFSSHTHQQIIIGSCGDTCHYQPIGYQQGKGQDSPPALQKRDPPTAVCDRKKKEWNFKDHCNCIDLCEPNSPGLPKLSDVRDVSDPDLPPSSWEFVKETGVHGEWIMDINGRFNRAELRCGRQEDIDRVCGPKGLRKRDKRHYFCANGEWISGADNPRCACEDNKKAKKSKDKHNKDKPKKNKKRPDINSSDDRPNKPSKKEQKKHKKNKH